MQTFLKLVCLLPPVNTKKTSFSTSRGSTTAALEKLIIYYKKAEEFVSTSTQPQLIATGPNKKAISNFFVSIDGKLIPVPVSKIDNAIDFIFKTHFVFDVEYEKSLISFWKFLQNDVYKIKCTVNNTLKKVSLKLLNYEQI